jgi:calcineurin-like phosphoesterase family protein
MPNTFFSSDHHLGHQGIITFTRNDGVTPLRDFPDVDIMNEHIIAQHNSVVGPKDTCWFLGDVVINRRFLRLIERFNGRKRLVLGNHDIFKNKDYYAAGFEDLHSFRKFEGFVATHIPVHRESLRSSWGKNVHGHMHSNRVMKTVNFDEKGALYYLTEVVDPDYYCVCMEQLDDYKPISIDELRNKL